MNRPNRSTSSRRKPQFPSRYLLNMQPAGQRRFRASLEPLEARNLLAVIAVTTTNQQVNNDGLCSLQEAIFSANFDDNIAIDPANLNGPFITTGCTPGSGADTIELAAGGVYQVSGIVQDQFNQTGPSVNPFIFSEITIAGNGARLERVGGLNLRAFAVGDLFTNIIVDDRGNADPADDVVIPAGTTGNLALENIHIKDFQVHGGNGADGGGGGLGAGAAIYNTNGTVFVENSTFENNRATGGNGGANASTVGGGGGGGLNGNGGGEGNGGNFQGGGGGGGARGDGGTAGAAGGGGGGTANSGVVGGAALGGLGGFNSGGKGGDTQGNPGGSGFAAGGGGGGGASNNAGAGGAGGAGSYGAGGGGGGAATAGNNNGGAGGAGGFGGGGAAGGTSIGTGANGVGGAGGFGGGGGAGLGGAANGSAGLFGGDAGNGNGGGGAALGGAIFSDRGNLTIVNSTFFGNTVTAGAAGGAGATAGTAAGGAIFTRNGDVTIRSTTISNSNNIALAIANDGVNGDTFLTVRNSIIANTTGGAPDAQVFNFDSPNAFVIQFESGNLVEVNGTDTDTTDPLFGVVTSDDPMLQPLALNAPGNTPTMAIPLLSPAVNAASDSSEPDTDQRGVDRPQGLGFDIGAFEVTTALNVCGDQQDVNQDDTILIIRNAVDPTLVDVSINGLLAYQGPLGLLPQINVFGIGGNDNLIIDSTNGLITLPLGIRYDGDGACQPAAIFFGGEGGFPALTPGAGTDSFGVNYGYDRGVDRLTLIQTGGPTQTSSTLSVGTLPGSGVSTIIGPAGTQQVYFEELEPVVDSVPSATMVLNSLPGISTLLDADNAINYTTGLLFDNTWGRVTVDNFEPLEFKNKTTLVINAGAGTDTINLANPDTPTGLTGMTVDGGDPGALDTLIVTGTTAAETFEYAPTGGSDAGALVIPGADATFTRIESVMIDGRSTTNDDTLIVRSESGVDRISLIPGANLDAGTFQITSTAGTESTPPLTFRALGQDGFIQLLSGAGAGSREDTFEYLGTNTADTFNVTTANGGTVVLQPGSGGVSSRKEVRAPGVSDLILQGLADDDTFNITNAATFTSILVNGADPSASDILNLTGPTGAIAVNLANNAVVPNIQTTITGYGGTVTLTGVEVANLDGSGQAMTVNGTSLDDQITYRPTGVSAGTFTNAGLNTTFNFTALTGVFTIAGGTADVADLVILQGTNARDTIRIDQGARTAQVNAFKSVTLAATIELLSALGLLGQDTFQVVPGAGVGGGIDNLIVDVDGGGGAANDALVVLSANGGALAANQFAVVKKNADITSGTVRVYTAAVPNPDINYSNIHTVSPNVFVNGINPNLLVLGPDNNDPNEFLATSTFLGSGSTLQIQHAAIFPNAQENPGLPADQDFYRVVAQHTGTLDFQVYFRLFANTLLPQGGALNIQVFDAAGNVIGSAVPAALTFGAIVAAPGSLATGDAGARVRIPVVAGQSYYLRVFGQTPNPNTLPNLVVNGYDATIVNTPAAVPYDLELDDVIGASEVNNAAAPTTTTFTASTLPNPAVAPFAGLNSASGYYVGKYVNFLDGPAAGQRALITAYNVAATTATFTLATPLSVAPVAGNDFIVESVDSGRSQLDDKTRDNTPTIFLRLDDGLFLNDLPGNGVPNTPPVGVIPIPLSANGATPGYRVAIFDEGNTPPQTGTAPQTPVGFATPVVGQQGVYTFTFTTPLSDGSHFITARVQMIDPALPTNKTGFGDRSLSLEVVVDTGPPPVFFGWPADVNDGLDPASDSGVVGQSATFSDRITNVTVPSFFGTAEADSVVRLFIDANNNGVFEPGTDLQIGATVAVPIDGTNQYPNGQWTVTSTLDLNDPLRLPLLPHDGLRRIFVTAEDPSGNVNPGAGQVIQQLTIFLDTAGPQVTNVFITSDPTYNLFGLKPNDLRPTPLVYSLSIALQDLPARAAGFLYNAIQSSNPAPGVPFTLPNPGIFKVEGDHNGVISITSVTVVNAPPVVGQPATATVLLNFARPLPDDRFTLTVVAEGLVDPAGNALDGENNAVEPNNGPTFPTGDGQPGGNFVARFTVDSRPEIGTYAAATVFVDINGNFVYDPDARNNDITNRDLNFTLQVAGGFGGSTSSGGFEVHDGLFAGNFKADNVATANGFDKLAAYGFLGSAFRWLVDNNGDGVITPSAGDINVVQPAVAGLNLSALPIAGNFNLAQSGDEVGLFDGTRFYLDTNANHVIDPADLVVTTALRGTPIVGDFDGDGFDDFGTWKDDVFYFDLTNGVNQGWDGAVDATIQFGFPGNAELPVAADMDMDGIDDVGLFVPRRSGTTVPEDAEWYFLLSNFPARVGAAPVPLSSSINHPFSPSPLGHDIHAQFGDEFALPIVGNFDPPVAAAAATAAASNPLDVSGDKLVTALDVLLVVNSLNTTGTHSVFQSAFTSDRLDANRDGLVSPLDALVIVNGINSRSSAQQAGAVALASSAPSSQAANSADLADVAFGIVASGSPAESSATEPALSVPVASVQAIDAVFADPCGDAIDPVSMLAADTALARVQSRGRTAGPSKVATALEKL